MKIIIGIIVAWISIHISFCQNNVTRIMNEDERGHLLITDFELLNSEDTLRLKYYELVETGISKSNLGEYEMAILDFDSAILLRPNLYKAYLNRSVAYSKLNDYQNALKDINKAIEIDSSKYEAYFNRGIFNKDLGLFESAVQDFKISIGLNPDFSYSYSYLGECYLQIGDHQLSILYFNKAIDIEPKNPEFYYSRSVYYSNIHDSEKEVQDLKIVISLNAMDNNALNNLGYFYFENSELDSAIYYYTRAINCDSTNLRYWCNRARAYETKNDYKSAIRDMTFAINSLPTEKYFYKRRYELYLLAGQKNEAEKDLKMLKKLK